VREVRVVGEVIACAADLDGDGALTVFDFLEFQNLFDAGDLRADFDGDGSLSLFDFLAFQNLFDAGC
jgi:glycosylphosphatidylinositol phospholipase D